MVNSERYPAKAYDRDLNDWEVTERDLSQIHVAEEIANALSYGLALRGGPLVKQPADGGEGREDGSVVSVVWGSIEREDGSRRLLGWYETGRGK